jgi:ADP-ribosylglycohydrolase/PKD domain
VMLAAMHAEAFGAESLSEIIDAGRTAVPKGTAYRAMIEHVLRLHRRFPGDWTRSWRRIERRWNAHRAAVKPDPRYVHREFSLDQKLNGAYVLLGLLYGRGDFARTIRISMRAGQDSDCNPSNAASVIGTWLGYDAIPRRFTRGLSSDRRFPSTAYTLRRAIAATVEVAKDVTVTGGGVPGAPSWEIPDSPVTTPIAERLPRRRDPTPKLDASALAAGGLTVAFDAAARDSDGISGYWWSFGDLSDGEGAMELHTYKRPGTYRATVWAADGHGRTRTRIVKVVVG